MIRHFRTGLILVLFAVSSGMLLSFVSGLPDTAELAEFQEEFKAIGDKALSMEEFEELRVKSERVLENKLSSDFAFKRFSVDFIALPFIILILSYCWFRIGLYLSGYSPTIIFSMIFLSSSALLLLGYSYQPFVHMASLVAGLFYGRRRAD